MGLLSKKQVLVVGNDGVQLYITDGKRTSLYEDFSDAGGDLSTRLRTAFKEVRAPLTILFDVVEQQYRKETIPKVSFIDKKKVVTRKLMMAFPQQQMRAFLPSKQKPKPGDGMVALFAALAPNLTIVQIMDAVLGSEVSVTGTGLLPVESTTMMVKLQEALHKQAKTANKSRWSVLITHHKTGGLRQIVTKDGELALTRLTPLAIDPKDTHALADEVSREFAATLTYLSRFGFAANDGLDVMLLSSDSLCDRVRQQSLPVTSLYAMTPSQAGRLIGIEPIVDKEHEVYGDVMHAAWVGVQRSLLMPLSAPLLDKIVQARQAAQLSLFILCVAILYMGYQSVELFLSNQQANSAIVELKSQRVSLQSQYDTISKRINTLRYPPEQTQMTLDVYELFSKKGLHEKPLIEKMVSVIDKSKLILKKIDVKSNTNESVQNILTKLANGEIPSPSAMFNDAQQAIQNINIPNDLSDLTGSDPAAIATEPAPIVPPDPDATRMDIAIEIGFVPNTSIEEAARQTNALADSLRAAFANSTVTIDKIVGNLSIEQTVQGISEQVSANTVAGRLVNEETSTLTLTGVSE
jgi:hypothetical protein